MRAPAPAARTARPATTQRPLVPAPPTASSPARPPPRTQPRPGLLSTAARRASRPARTQPPPRSRRPPSAHCAFQSVRRPHHRFRAQVAESEGRGHPHQQPVCARHRPGRAAVFRQRECLPRRVHQEVRRARPGSGLCNSTAAAARQRAGVSDGGSKRQRCRHGRHPCPHARPRARAPTPKRALRSQVTTHQNTYIQTHTPYQISPQVLPGCDDDWPVCAHARPRPRRPHAPPQVRGRAAPHGAVCGSRFDVKGNKRVEPADSQPLPPAPHNLFVQTPHNTEISHPAPGLM